jgi:RimJ/RimL family protein N-acetyltransferase
MARDPVAAIEGKSGSQVFDLAPRVESLKCQRVEFKAGLSNLPSCRALEKLGAMREAVLRGYNKLDDYEKVYQVALPCRQRLSGVRWSQMQRSWRD